VQRALVTIAACSLAIAGCGGSASSGKSDVAEAVSQFWTAFLNGDAATACGMLTPQLRARLDRGPDTCAEVVRVTPAVIEYQKRSELQRQFEEKNWVVTVEGPLALVSLPDKPGSVKLMKQADGRWLISQLDSLRP